MSPLLELVLIAGGAVFAIAVVISTAIDAARWASARRKRRRADEDDRAKRPPDGERP